MRVHPGRSSREPKPRGSLWISCPTVELLFGTGGLVEAYRFSTAVLTALSARSP
jgi:hypothetical protein